MYMNCKTWFSFRYGTFSTKELVDTAVEKGVGSLALTNINSTCDVWDFIRYCNEAGIKPIPGVEVRNGDKLLYILLAANNKGLTWIHEFLSRYLLTHKPFPEVTQSLAFLKIKKMGLLFIRSAQTVTPIAGQ
jgi:DNA polymerase III alpha subunit